MSRLDDAPLQLMLAICEEFKARLALVDCNADATAAYAKQFTLDQISNAVTAYVEQTAACYATKNKKSTFEDAQALDKLSMQSKTKLKEELSQLENILNTTATQLNSLTPDEQITKHRLHDARRSIERELVGLKTMLKSLA